jgi:hypothetical protein
MRISDLSADELRKLNSATQYPSILTYHVLGQRGRLTEARTADFRDEARTDVIVTEKIDGTNARIILPPRGAGSALVGSPPRGAAPAAAVVRAIEAEAMSPPRGAEPVAAAVRETVWSGSEARW